MLSGLSVSPVPGDVVPFPETTDDTTTSEWSQESKEFIHWHQWWTEIQLIDLGIGEWLTPPVVDVPTEGFDGTVVDEDDQSEGGSLENPWAIDWSGFANLDPGNTEGLDPLEPNRNEVYNDFSGTLEDFLAEMMVGSEVLPALNARAASGDFSQIYPVFSVATGVIGLETFPGQIPPLEVSISIGDQAEDVLLPVSENTIDVHFDDLDSWLFGSPDEQLSQLQEAAVQTLTSLVPDVPVLLTMKSAAAGTQRFLVMDGFGYPMTRRSAELDPVFSEGVVEIGSDDGGEQEEESVTPPVIPPIVSGGEQTTEEESGGPQSEPEPVTADRVVPISADSNRSVLIDKSGPGYALLVACCNVEDAEPPGSLSQSSEILGSRHRMVWESVRVPHLEWSLTFGGQWAQGRAFGTVLSLRSKTGRQNPSPIVDDLSDSSMRFPGRQEQIPEQSDADCRTSDRLVQSPVTTEPANASSSTRHQLLPSSSQIQLRRYRVAHRQAVAAEYPEVTLRETISVCQERLEDNAPSQLRYVVNPRAPPRGPPRSEYLKENFADNDLLERLRYSIAPRGPSLADSSSLSPGSVFFSGPRVSPVFSCQLGC